jgi:uncharacterized protein YlzI (FlbEa/FlbD family)
MHYLILTKLDGNPIAIDFNHVREFWQRADCVVVQTETGTYEVSEAFAHVTEKIREVMG